MSNNRKNITENNEDYFVQATLLVEDNTIENVLCKIYLPERITDKPILKFKPSKEQYCQIISSHEGQFHAEVIGFNKNKEALIKAPVIYFSEMKTKH
ncbi:MAG TPA: hypothetical protein ENK91_05945, partial [Bacteroidetes bacterium]|nr:hypothetical protein [Bacteroidota bacterium]